MKIVFMGSAAFAVPSLAALLESGHEVALVVTQCDKPAGRGLNIQSCPVATFAGSKSIELFQPEKLKDQTQIFFEIKPDLIVVVAYGKMIPKEVLSKFRCVNVHASLLPKYRGAAPINWAIANGETKSGVTTMFINEKMDAGDILLQEEVEIGPSETAIQLGERLAIIGANLLLETLDKLGKIKPRPQKESEATFAPMLKKEDGLINWKKPAKDIMNLVRAMQPWPVAHTKLDGKMLKIFGARVSDEKRSEAPGTVVEATKNLQVASGSGTLYLTDVQLEGKKRLTIDSFLRGHKINAGTILK